MALTVERMQQEPIIIATFTGGITPDLVREMYAQSAALVDEIGGVVYRITDVRNTDTSFSDLVFILAEASQGQPGSPSDSRIKGMLLGSNKWSLMFSESVKQNQYGKMNVPRFMAMEDAMAYIHEQVAQVVTA